MITTKPALSVVLRSFVAHGGGLAHPGGGPALLKKPKRCNLKTRYRFIQEMPARDLRDWLDRIAVTQETHDGHPRTDEAS